MRPNGGGSGEPNEHVVAGRKDIIQTVVGDVALGRGERI